MMKNYKIGFSPYGFAAFALQEVPALLWLLRPPAENPLAGNAPATPLLGVLEQGGGILTVLLTLFLVRKDALPPKFKSPYFTLAVLCLAVYDICWAGYFRGAVDGWRIVLGLSAPVPLYYLFVALWLKNRPAAIPCLLFFIGHVGSNILNYLL